MSTGNGRPILDRAWQTAEAKSISEGRPIPIPRHPHQIDRPLSASEREQQRIAYIAAVDAMAVTLRTLVEAHKSHRTFTHSDSALNNTRHAEVSERMDAIERAIVVDRSRTRWQRLRWLVVGR